MTTTVRGKLWYGPSLGNITVLCKRAKSQRTVLLPFCISLKLILNSFPSGVHSPFLRLIHAPSCNNSEDVRSVLSANRTNQARQCSRPEGPSGGLGTSVSRLGSSSSRCYCPSQCSPGSCSMSSSNFRQSCCGSSSDQRRLRSQKGVIELLLGMLADGSATAIPSSPGPSC